MKKKRNQNHENRGPVFRRILSYMVVGAILAGIAGTAYTEIQPLYINAAETDQEESAYALSTEEFAEEDAAGGSSFFDENIEEELEQITPEEDVFSGEESAGDAGTGESVDPDWGTESEEPDWGTEDEGTIDEGAADEEPADEGAADEEPTTGTSGNDGNNDVRGADEGEAETSGNDDVSGIDEGETGAPAANDVDGADGETQAPEVTGADDFTDAVPEETWDLADPNFNTVDDAGGTETNENDGLSSISETVPDEGAPGESGEITDPEPGEGGELTNPEIEEDGNVDDAEDNKILPDGVLTAEADGAVVEVSFTEAAGLPEGTELQVRRIYDDAEVFSYRYDSAGEWIEEKYQTPETVNESETASSDDSKEEGPDLSAEKTDQEKEKAESDEAAAETDADITEDSDTTVEETEDQPEQENKEAESEEAEETEDSAAETTADSTEDSDTTVEETEEQLRQENKEAESGEVEETEETAAETAADSAEDSDTTVEDTEEQPNQENKEAESEKAEEAEDSSAETAADSAEDSNLMVEETEEQPEQENKEKEAVETEEAVAETEAESAEHPNMTDEEKEKMPVMKSAEIEVFALFDISLIHEGIEIEPLDKVQVTMEISDEAFSSKTDLVMIHYFEEEGADGKAVELAMDQNASNDGTGRVKISFTAGAFSEYAVMALRERADVVSDNPAPSEPVPDNAAVDSGSDKESESADSGKEEEEHIKPEETENTDQETSDKKILADGVLTAEADGVVVEVSFTEAAGLPMGTELQVRRIRDGDEGFSENYDSALEWVENRHSGEGRPEGESPSVNTEEGASEAAEDVAATAQDTGTSEKSVSGEDAGTVEKDSSDESAEDAEAMAQDAGTAQKDTSEEGGGESGQSGGASETTGIAAFVLLDISLVCNGEEIEPLEEVQVRIRFSEAEFSDEDNLMMIHYNEEPGAEKKTIEAPSEQEVSSDQKGRVEASFTADSFSEYAVMALRAGPFIVWFDGTDGMGTINSLVRGATNVMQTITTNTVALPTGAGNNSKYKLNGWYDINTGNYYKPGATATINQNTVFYAEWVLADYNLGPAATVVSNQPDLSSFVTTEVFDYNEIFNPYHGAYLSQSNIQWGSHTETWRDSQNISDGNDFLFTNWYNQQFGETYLAFAANLKAGRNRYQGAGDLTTGIVSSPEDQLMQDLFDTSDAPGKVYLGQGNMLYQYDNNPNSSRYGYYYYDSDKNAADYNQANERFYVYTGTQTIRGEGNDAGTSVTGFMPFEKGTATINQKTGQVDFWFGMVSTVDFFLPDKPGTGGNKAIGGKDMEFYFSGDDDVWVFVDGKLLLDLGGIHRKINGSINFSNGKIYVENNEVGTIPDDILSGDHQLQFYYLERGSSWSNASIYFNIAPRYSMELIKHDADNTNQLLEGAVFNIYMDENCTIPAHLWTSKEAYDSGEAAVSTFTTGSGGKVSCYGLYANRNYYLKEVSSPPGYPSISNRIIALSLNAYGDASISSGDDIASLTQDGATKLINLSVTNKLPATIDIPVEKRWYNEDGSVLDPQGEDAITVELYRAEVPIPTGSGGSGGTGGNTGATLPVNIRTQYFGTGNGSNQDTSVITGGDLTHNTVVTYGGSLTINVDVTEKDAGIYSMTVNGEVISPESTSGECIQNCLIGGKWGNYPPRQATYVIDPAEGAMDISITLIGYLGWGGTPHHPDTSYTMTISTAVTEPASGPDPGGESGGEEPEIPAVMPEGAVLVATKSLSGTNNWKDTFTDLPARTEDGSSIYVYYVKEIYPDGYSTSYIGNGSIGGTVSIYNVRLRELIVKKEWKDIDNEPLTEGLPESITLKLTQYDDTAGTQREIDVTLTADGGWMKKWRSNSSELNEQEGHTYRYKITEVNAGSEYMVTYSENNSSGVTEGTITVTNRKKSYSVDFIKADSTDHSIVLPGADFSLYSSPECGEESIVEAYDTDPETGERKTVFSSGENGAFTVYGLTAGTYYLKELSAPEGYYLIDYPLEIVLTDDAGGVAGVRGVRLVDGELTEVTDEITRIELAAGSMIQVFIYDSPLFELPSTGGMGSWLFIIGGFAVMFAVLLLNIKYIRKEDV